MPAALALVIAGVDGHNGAVPEACNGFRQVPRHGGAFRFRMELGAPRAPMHAAAVGAGVRYAGDDNS